MKKTEYSIQILAPQDIVWKALWEDKNYRYWTKAFAENSHAKGSWNQGDTIEFLDGTGCGMYSIVHANNGSNHMAFKHMGEIKDNQRQPNSAWAGAIEDYKLSTHDNATLLVVQHDIADEWESYFSETFPKALALVKERAESLV